MNIQSAVDVERCPEGTEVSVCVCMCGGGWGGGLRK